MLGGVKHLLGDELQVRKDLRTAFPAPQDAGIGQITDDAPDGGVMPVLPRPGPVAQAVQVGGDTLCAKALVDVFLKEAQAAILLFGELCFDLRQCPLPPLCFVCGQDGGKENILSGRSWGIPQSIKREAVVIIPASQLNFVVVIIGPAFPLKKFLFTGKIFTGQADMLSGDALADDGGLV